MESQALELDPYLIDVLMRDLVGHDRSPAAFLVYLWLWRQGRAGKLGTVAASLQMIAHGTGLSKSAVQRAVRRLKQRRLLDADSASATTAPVYTLLQPWRQRLPS